MPLFKNWYKALHVYVVVSFSFCFILIIIQYHTQKQRKIIIEQRIKLNRNKVLNSLSNAVATKFDNTGISLCSLTKFVNNVSIIRQQV